MRSLLRQVAVACIVAGTLPQAAAAAAALEHGHDVPVGSMLPLLHGHAHSAETPDHDHPLTVPTSGSLATDARGPLQPGLLVGCVATYGACALVDVSALSARSAKQRPTPLISTILRI